MNVTLTVPTGYAGHFVVLADGLKYYVTGAAVIVPQNFAAPLLAAGFVSTGVVS